MTAGLVALDDVRRRLRITGQRGLGVRPIEVARIVGSLDRSTDFDPDFRPRLRRSAQRLASLRAAFPDGDGPPIEAFEVGGAYFVADGHHRVALARQRSATYIDADVTRLETNYALGPGVDVRQLVHTEQQRLLLHESGPAQARPDAVVEFSRPGGYPELLELIKAHGYDMARRRGTLPDRCEVAADWYDTVYAPGVVAVRRESLPEIYAYKTDADLFLCVYQRRRALRVASPGRRLRRRRPRRARPPRQPPVPQGLPRGEEQPAAPARLIVVRGPPGAG